MMFTLLTILIHFIWNQREIDGLVVTGVHFLSSSGKSDYVLVGEGFTLSCLYLPEANESPRTIEILKDGNQIYEHNLETNETWFSGLLENSIDVDKSSPSQITVKNASLAFHGNYSCKVKSQVSCSSQDTNLIVINDACKEKNWSLRSDMIHCLEIIEFECFGMFPKPSPSCGVYEQKTGRYITAEPFNDVRKLSDGTYFLAMSHRYSAQEYRAKKGDFLFRCMLSVAGTSWLRVINSNLFSRRGCPMPPNIENGGYFMSPRKTCWDTPTEGSLLSYSCSHNYTLSHSQPLVCVNGAWRSIEGDLPEGGLNLTTLPLKSVKETIFPTCNKSSISSINFILIILIIILQLKKNLHGFIESG